MKVFFGGLAALLFAACIFGNAWSLIYSNPVAFQRLGSVWIALTLLILGLSRFVISEVNKAVHGRGPEAETARRKLGSAVYSEGKGWLNYMSKDGVEYERPLMTWEEIGKQVDDLEDHVSFRLQPTEILVSVIATIQWGYGDLIFCFLHGKGFSTC